MNLLYLEELGILITLYDNISSNLKDAVMMLSTIFYPDIKDRFKGRFL